MSIKVCHVTSVHSAMDGRIFNKQCRSLARANYSVYLIAPSVGDTVIDGVNIIGVPQQKSNRIYRIFRYTNLIFKKAIAVDADIYHLHDPELLPLVSRLLNKGKQIIFDSHEDVPLQIERKYWIPKILRLFISKLYKLYERRVLKKVDAIITVTPSIVDRLIKINPRTFQVTNYPIIDDLVALKDLQTTSVCFAGSLDESWMLSNIIKAINKIDNVEFRIAGSCTESYIKLLKKDDINNKVVFYGQIPHTQVSGFIQNSFAGMALYDYCAELGNNMGTLGNTKLFEYMSAGVPVICTDFLLWKKIIVEEKCGICVNPRDVESIEAAIRYLVDNHEIAMQMGRNGQIAVKERYNWKTQELILLDIYKKTLSNAD
jgi:glycosyltransferase involved in cell wall biosynthesis